MAQCVLIAAATGEEERVEPLHAFTLNFLSNDATRLDTEVSVCFANVSVTGTTSGDKLPGAFLAGGAASDDFLAGQSSCLCRRECGVCRFVVNTVLRTPTFANGVFDPRR